MARVLMLCHDQQLDRRVVAQANSLIANGYRVTLVALSFDADEERETTPEGIDLIRMGLASIVPENPVYRRYMDRQHRLNRMLNHLSNRNPKNIVIFQSVLRILSRINGNLYIAELLAKYRNRNLGDPLPFRKAFVEAAGNLPADIVQVHDLPTLEAGVEIARKKSAPLVYDAHELYPEQKSFSSAQRKICAMAEARLIRAADHVFTVNESIACEMASRYGIEKPTVLLNAIDPPHDFDPEAGHDLLRQKLRISGERKILLFQGGFAPHRNLENLIKAFSLVKSPDVDLVLMGFGDYGGKLKEIATRRRLLNNKVHFLPAVPPSELLEHSASADMGVIPYPHVDLNSYYCTPNKLFEFIQAGLPIIANASPELQRFVGDSGFGMIAPMDSARRIAEAVDRAFQSGRREKWRSNILSKRELFTWRAQENAYISVIDQLASSNKTNRANVEAGGQ